MSFFSRIATATKNVGNWPCYGGLDLSLVNDYSAVVLIAWNPKRQKFRLAHVKVWKPTKADPMTVEILQAHLGSIRSKFRVMDVYADPFGLGRSEECLRRFGVPVTLFHQTEANLNAITTLMQKTFVEDRIELFWHADLESALLNSRAVRGVRGWRIKKIDGSRSTKIDAAVALAMAIQCLIDHGADAVGSAPGGLPQSIPSGVNAASIDAGARARLAALNDPNERFNPNFGLFDEDDADVRDNLAPMYRRISRKLGGW